MQKFLYGAFLLMVAGFITRVLAFGYRVYIVRLIGPEGIGLYEMVFPVYTLILVITTAGIPVAISKLVSEEYARKQLGQLKKIFFVSFFFLLLSGVISTILIVWFAPYLTGKIFTDPRVYWPFIVSIPAIFIVAVGSTFRGYFQGLQQMLPLSLSQIVEQMVRIIVGICLAGYLLAYGVEFAAAGLALAMVSGEIAGLMILVLFLLKNKEMKLPYHSSKVRNVFVLKRIYGFAIPVTLTRVVLASSLTLQAILIPKRLLVAGHSIREATQIFGYFSGMAVSLINLPTIITVSLAISLVPAISEAIACKNYALIRTRVQQALKITFLTAIPCMVIFFKLSYEIMALLYDAPEASGFLKAMALGCPFFYLQQTTGGILQGMGQVRVIFKNALISTAVTLAGIFCLTASPLLGIKGAIIAVIGGATVYALLNVSALAKILRLDIAWDRLISMPVLAGCIMYLFMDLLHLCLVSVEQDWLNLLTTILGGCCIYVAVLLFTGTIKFVDLLKRLARL